MSSNMSPGAESTGYNAGAGLGHGASNPYTPPIASTLRRGSYQGVFDKKRFEELQPYIQQFWHNLCHPDLRHFNFGELGQELRKLKVLRYRVDLVSGTVELFGRDGGRSTVTLRGNIPRWEVERKYSQELVEDLLERMSMKTFDGSFRDAVGLLLNCGIVDFTVTIHMRRGIFLTWNGEMLSYRYPDQIATRQAASATQHPAGAARARSNQPQEMTFSTSPTNTRQPLRSSFGPIPGNPNLRQHTQFDQLLNPQMINPQTINPQTINPQTINNFRQQAPQQAVPNMRNTSMSFTAHPMLQQPWNNQFIQHGPPVPNAAPFNNYMGHINARQQQLYRPIPDQLGNQPPAVLDNGDREWDPSPWPDSPRPGNLGPRQVGQQPVPFGLGAADMNSPMGMSPHTPTPRGDGGMGSSMDSGGGIGSGSSSGGNRSRGGNVQQQSPTAISPVGEEQGGEQDVSPSGGSGSQARKRPRTQ
ncbi:hypothetical protein B0T17DRAFT_618262 [Bombardia bombarda]|uniref:Uncharacterized protein n=1 Tax=Bombardia bombarda TaxID=252184 RepID=A0AA40C1Z2_9PEZI|nr:hypothetical protein B0T17DRAFT_618262 [Bombardia bombarda]